MFIANIKIGIPSQLVPIPPPQARRVVPHTHFTFAKLWVHSALFEVRQGNLDAGRKLLGQALGRCPKDKLFKE